MNEMPRRLCCSEYKRVITVNQKLYTRGTES